MSCLASLSFAAAPADQPQQFDIPAQPVANALLAFGAQTDMQLLYRYDAVKDVHAAHLVGRFEKLKALRLLLRGTGLEAVVISENTASIRRIHASDPGARKSDRTAWARQRHAAGPDDADAARAASARAFDDRIAPGEGSLESVMVTGSRIRRIAFDTLQPTLMIERRAIEERAWDNIGDAFAELPAFGPPGNSPIGGQSAVSVGQSFVNFLGLGSQRTLTLVDGRRVVAANTPSINGAAAPGLQVDLNTIPVALIDRVEIIGVGGAPVYGADAVAGTVNIVRRRDFDGFGATAQLGATQRGGAERRRMQGVYGHNFADGSGNFAASFEYAERGDLRANERAATAANLSFQAPLNSAAPFRQLLVPNTRVVIVNYSGLPLTAPVANQTDDFRFAVKDADGHPLQFAPDGSLIPFDPGVRTGSPIFFSGGDGLDLAATTSLLTRSERTLANLFLDYEIADSVTLGLEGWYAHTRSQEPINQPPFNESLFATPDETPTHVLQGPIPLRLDNPFLSPATRATLTRNADLDGDGAADANIDFDGDGTPETAGFWLAKGHQDLFAGNPSSSRQDSYRGVVALSGAAAVAGRSWEWEVSYNHGRTHSASSNRVILNAQFNRAIDAIRDPASGAVRCRDTSDSRCVPLNLFGFGAPSPAAAAYVTAATTARADIEQRVLSANVSGSPFSLPTGAVRIAAGAEYRRESSAFEPDRILTSGVARGAAFTPISGSFHTREIYTEAVVPLLGPQQELAYAHKLDLEGAVRSVDHSTAGADLTWTAGLRFAPHPDLRLRGNYTESIRAPAITELFLPPATIFALAADPCDRRLINQGPNPELRAANCARDGITQPFSSDIVNASQPMSVEGNRSLRNERADSWSIGLTLQPHAAPGLALALDWIDIRLRDAIERFDATTVLQACYDSPAAASADICSRFARDSDGQVVDVRTGFLNAGIVDFAGLTAEASYETELAGGALTLGLHYFRLDRLDVSVTGIDFNPGAGELSNSRNRAAAQVAYRNGALRGSLHAQYVGPAAFDLSDGPADREVRGVEAFWTFDAAIGYTFRNTISLQLNVDNVFDAQPPFASMTGALGIGASSAPATYFPGLLGRSYALSARVTF